MSMTSSIAPPDQQHRTRWTTPSGITVTHTARNGGSASIAEARLQSSLDGRPGMLLYQPGDRAIGYVDPPVELSLRGQELTVRALNPRGRLLLRGLHDSVAGALRVDRDTPDEIRGQLPVSTEAFTEEDRTRHVGVFAAIRAVVAALAAPDDALLGLFGAFGYDLIFHVDPIPLRQHRPGGTRDLVLHLPDRIHELDLRGDRTTVHQYDFCVEGTSTADLPATPIGPAFGGGGRPATVAERDHAPGLYARVVEQARTMFKAGELFEVVPSQAFRRRCTRQPAEVFRWLREHNRAPHSVLVSLGEAEYLIGASPEIFVRVAHPDAPGEQHLLVESAPISGTIARGRDALEDAVQVRALLNSYKEESELTMCTDVDRNDKSRVCVPGSVQVTARRQIELYPTLIHTVDTVQGRLRPELDALDAFTSHLWAVTVTGAPKLAAVEFIERHERSPRRWYGGAVGRIGFDGSLHTVLTLRTIHLQDGVATVRAGATVLYESSPADEERETELKAAALLAAVDGDRTAPSRRTAGRLPSVPRTGDGLSVLLVDHRDSFVHCLADYCRQTGAQVSTYRSGRHLAMIEQLRPDLIVLSPGPGKPSDFAVNATIARAAELGVPVFGVCLGLQGLVEYCGGRLGLLGHPVHGKPSEVRIRDGGGEILAGLPETFTVGRYHSLYARMEDLPAVLAPTAVSTDGVVMAVEHRDRPFAAVQFHPESVLTALGRTGHQVMANVMTWAKRSQQR